VDITIKPSTFASLEVC